MLRYFVRRAPSAVLVLFLASLVIFLVIRLIPGDPAASLAGSEASPEQVAVIRHELGLDRSVPAQYASWLGGIITGDMGTSYAMGGSIGSLVATGFGNTLLLAVTALILASVMALIVGVIWAGSRRRWVDVVLTGVNTVFVALPTFVTGVALMLLFAVVWQILPAGGVPRGGFTNDLGATAKHLVLPAVCLAIPVSAVLTRFLTETLRTELRQPYITTATALGISSRRRLLRHALRNALPTAVTVLGIQVGTLLGGAVLVEVVFSWPGTGKLIEQAIYQRDYPMVQILLLLAVAVFVAVQLVTDLLHAYLDPRVRVGGLE
jgi:peptide/nickel transport system permease protein